MKKPDLVTICETKLHKNSTFDLEGYEVKKSSLKAGKEGILIAAREGTYGTMEIIYESEERNIATAEIAYPNDTLSVIVAHGPQEEDPQERREEFFEDLQAKVERGISSGNRVIITGDLNARLEYVDGQVLEAKGNGKLLRQIIDKYDLRVANFKSDSEGKWTRIQKKGNNECKSTIDYIITDSGTNGLVHGTVVDEDKIYTPYRVTKQKKERILTFSDHCTISTNINICKGSGKRTQGIKKKIWIIEEEGLCKFREATMDDLGLGDMSLHSSPYDVWMKKVNQLMHQCFIKKTIKVGQHKINKIGAKARKLRDILKDASKQGKIQREIVKGYLKKLLELEAKRDENNQMKKLNETVQKLTTDDILSKNAFWKLRKSVSKKVTPQLQAVYKKNGGIATTESDIKDEINKEFQHRLRNRNPAPGWEGYVRTINEIVDILLQNTSDSSTPFSKEEMTDAIKKLKAGISPDFYDMHTEVIIHAGDGILDPLLQVFNIIKSTREIPEKWQNVLVTMIYKNKGSHMDLEKYRGIFLTVIISKVFELMLKNRMKPKLDQVSLFQAGSRNGKGPPDNLYLLRSVIDYHKYMNKPVYITAYDFRQAFDSLWIQDCILALQRLGIDDYMLQLIYEMNKKTIMQVKTPYGLTDPIEIRDIVKQGGVLGSAMCSATTAEYCGRNKGITIGDVQITALAYVDDIIDVNETNADTKIAHHNAQEFSMEKKLDFAGDKCNGMLVNGKKDDRFPTLYIGKEIVKEVHLMTCLGDVFNSKGNNDDLVADRVKRGTACMVSINGFMRETQLGHHTISIHILLHDAIFVPSILFNAQAWSNMTEKNVEKITMVHLNLCYQLNMKFIRGRFLFSTI